MMTRRKNPGIRGIIQTNMSFVYWYPEDYRIYRKTGRKHMDLQLGNEPKVRTGLNRNFCRFKYILSLQAEHRKYCRELNKRLECNN